MQLFLTFITTSHCRVRSVPARVGHGYCLCTWAWAFGPAQTDGSWWGAATLKQCSLGNWPVLLQPIRPLSLEKKATVTTMCSWKIPIFKRNAGFRPVLSSILVYKRTNICFKPLSITWSDWNRKKWVQNRSHIGFKQIAASRTPKQFFFHYFWRKIRIKRAKLHLSYSNHTAHDFFLNVWIVFL